MIRRSTTLLVLAAVVALTPARAHAALAGENVGKATRATRTATPPTIDGRIDDVEWAPAALEDRFVQHFPDNGAPPSERTEIRVLYDDHAVYVAVRAWDDEATKIVRRLSRRDQDIETDWVNVAFDSGLTSASAYGFWLTAAGAQGDYVIYNDTSWSMDWDAVWAGATTTDAGGWSAEFAIPLSALRFSDAPSQVWGFQVERHVSRKKEDIYWSNVPRDVNAYVSRWGTLEGIEGVRPRRTLELRPYVATAMRVFTPRGGHLLGIGPNHEAQGDAQLGLDLKLGLTRSLTLDVTVNPDFGQVEADPEVLNLSRFETFFPEKRPFFLEGASIFDVQGVFYSRRIGQPPSRILAAAKLSGQIGDDLTVGALEAVTAPEPLIVLDDTRAPPTPERAPARNYTALRARYSLGGASGVGAMATAVTRLGDDPTRAAADHDAYVQSLDARWQPASGRLRLESQLVLSERVGGPAAADADGRACTDAPGDRSCTPITRPDGTRQAPGDVGVGGLVQVERRWRHWLVNARYLGLSPTLDLNDLGFLQEFNIHQVRAGTGWHDNNAAGAFLGRQFGADVSAIHDTDGVFLSGGASAYANLQWSSFWVTSVNLNVSPPGQKNPYETGDGAYLERLPWVYGSGLVATDGRRALVGSLGLEGGHALTNTGWILGGNAGVSAKVASRLTLDLGGNVHWEANDLRQWFYGGCTDDLGLACTVESGARTYRLAQLDAGALSLTLRGSWLFSPTLSLAAYAQLFMSQGDFHDRRVVRTSDARPLLRRADLEMDPGFTGDLDADGRPDDRFQDTSLNVNIVLRWDLLPGTTLIGVYTRAQAADHDLTGTSPRFRASGLSTGPTEEILLMKLVYYWTPGARL